MYNLTAFKYITKTQPNKTEIAKKNVNKHGK